MPTSTTKGVNQKGIVEIILVLAVVTILIGGALLYTQKSSNKSQDTLQLKNPEQTEKKESEWKGGGVAIEGNFADAEVIEVEDGKYRIYYTIEPEVPGNKLEIYSATSTDGKNWTKDEGIRKTFATFPDVIKLDDSRFRMYFQNAGVIKSAVSNDGLNWTDEPGIRVDALNNSGLKLENVAATTTTILPDGSYLMVYRGQVNKKYPEKTPNSSMQLLLYATSKDGLTFDKRGVALDSRTSKTLKGLTDGPEVVQWDNGEVRLYFWSYKGIYHVNFKDGNFTKEPVFDFTTSDNPLSEFPENPPGDPTLAKINGKWFMYYGQHTKGIYYVTF